MELPESLKIGAHTFKIVCASHWPDKGEDDLAMTVWEDQTIYILDRLPRTVMWASLWHEVLHVINPGLEHQLLYSLAEQEAQVLLDNNLLR